jgi:uncharacterized protein (TIGR02300 family)
MSKAARGTKRVCHGCGAKFYDLNHTPILCPLCGAEYKVARHASGLDGRSEELKAAVVPKPVRQPVAPAMEDVEMDLDIDPELATVEDEDLVSLEDVEEPEAPEDEDDAFLPEEDESEDDVSGFIGESRPKSEDEI